MGAKNGEEKKGHPLGKNKCEKESEKKMVIFPLEKLLLKLNEFLI